MGSFEVSAVLEQVEVTGEPYGVETAQALWPVAFSDADGVSEVLCEEDELGEGD